MSAFIVHMISEHPNSIEDIVNTFQSEQMPNVSQETQSWILMEILGAVPEEVVTIFLFMAMSSFRVWPIFSKFRV